MGHLAVIKEMIELSSKNAKVICIHTDVQGGDLFIVTKDLGLKQNKDDLVLKKTVINYEHDFLCVTGDIEPNFSRCDGHILDYDPDATVKFQVNQRKIYIPYTHVTAVNEVLTMNWDKYLVSIEE